LPSTTLFRSIPFIQQNHMLNWMPPPVKIEKRPDTALPFPAYQHLQLSQGDQPHDLVVCIFQPIIQQLLLNSKQFFERGSSSSIVCQHQIQRLPEESGLSFI